MEITFKRRNQLREANKRYYHKIENLLLIKNQSEHNSLHLKKRDKNGRFVSEVDAL